VAVVKTSGSPCTIRQLAGSSLPPIVEACLRPSPGPRWREIDAPRAARCPRKECGAGGADRTYGSLRDDGIQLFSSAADGRAQPPRPPAQPPSSSVGRLRPARVGRVPLRNVGSELTGGAFWPNFFFPPSRTIPPEAGRTLTAMRSAAGSAASLGAPSPIGDGMITACV